MLQLRLGDAIDFEGNEHIVAAREGVNVALRRSRDGAIVWVHLVALHDQLALASQGPGERTRRDFVSSVSDRELEELAVWVPRFNEIRYGVPDPENPSIAPRPGYADLTIGERRERMSQELKALGLRGVSPRSLRRKENAFREHGLYGVVDGRSTRHSSGKESSDSRLVELVLEVLGAASLGPTVTDTVRIARLKATALHRYGSALALPSDRTLRRKFDRYDPDRRRLGSAILRRTDANRPSHPPTPIIAAVPGQVVEIDCTKANIMTRLPSGKVARHHLIVAIDVATRSILGYDIVPVATSGVQHADLLARILRPIRWEPGMPEAMRLASSDVLPHSAMTAVDPRQRDAVALPYIVPKSITCDRGKDFLSATFTEACRTFHIDIHQAPPYSPDFKPHIERLMGSIDTMWMQYQPGYVGRSVEHRGKVSISEILNPTDLRRSFEAWWVTSYQNHPNQDLRDPDVPSVHLSPNQMYASLFDAVGPDLPPVVDSDTYIALMPIFRRTLRNEGFQVEHRFYWDKDLEPLRDMRAPTKDGKWEVHRDPHDLQRVWVRHPNEIRWIECRSTRYHLDDYPFASAHALKAGLDPADPAVNEVWAIAELTRRDQAGRKPGRAKAPRRPSSADKHFATLERRRSAADPRPAPLVAPEPLAPPPRNDLDEFTLLE